MKLNYTAKAIQLYIKQTGFNLNELAAKIGIGYATLNRYSKGERLPDIDILLRICNTLHLRINQFFVHPDIELTEVKIYHEEEWNDIIFRHERVEAIRLEKGLSKTELIKLINECGGTNITRTTYNNLITGNHFAYETILGLIEATGTSTDYLFDQQMPIPNEDTVIIPRQTLDNLKDEVTQLKDLVRELQLKNKRLEKMTLPRYEQRMENLDAEKVIEDFFHQAERSLIELRSWVKDYGHAKPKLYGEIEDKIRIAAEPATSARGYDTSTPED